MTNNFDYSVPAGLYFIRRLGRKFGMTYRRFESADAAIAFAVEQLSAAGLQSATLEVDEERFRRDDIRSLYDAAEFPLPRGSSAS